MEIQSFMRRIYESLFSFPKGRKEGTLQGEQRPGEQRQGEQQPRLRRQGERRQRTITAALSVGLLLTAAVLLGEWAAHLSADEQPGPSVILIPLDSRPVNTDLPVQLAAIADISVAVPKRESLDLFLTPGKTDELFGWLAEQKESSYDLTLIYINELLFGSLLHSREYVQYQDANAKTRQMYDYLLQRNRSAANRLVLVYILPRLLPSQYDEEMWVYEKELPELSQLRHRQALEPDNPELANRIQSLTESIPREIIRRYTSVYTEAYNVGLRLLDWLEQGLVDEVIIGLDDSAEFGLNVKAFADLKAYAAELPVSTARFLHGADELTPLIIARHCLDYGNDSEGFVLRYLTEGQEGLILPYEALPLTDNFQEKSAYLYEDKPIATARAGAAPYIGRPKYIYLFSDEEATAEELKATWETIRRDKTRPSGAYVGLADIAKTNGAWAPLIESIGPDRVYRYVDTYAGWNTAGNSLGTVMAHLLFWEAAQDFSGPGKKEARLLHETMQKRRLIDDYVFQSVVRQELIAWTVTAGFPYLSFGGRWMEANDQLQVMMEEALAPWPKFAPAQQGRSLSQKGQPFPWQFSFPWPRSFEIRIE